MFRRFTGWLGWALGVCMAFSSGLIVYYAMIIRPPELLHAENIEEIIVSNQKAIVIMQSTAILHASWQLEHYRDEMQALNVKITELEMQVKAKCRGKN